MSMGAKASKDRAEGSSVVIVLGGGKREMYSRPVSAQEVMLQHPQHVLTTLDVLGSDFRKAIVAPQTVLLPGKRYFLVMRRTLEWLLDPHTTLNCPNAGSRRNSDSASDPTHIDINLGHGVMDDMSTRPPDPIVASPHRPRAIVEHKPSITFTEERLNPARRRNVKGKTAKSPLRSISWSENTQRSRRSSPKVCPGEDGSEQISERALSICSSADVVKEEMIWNLESMIDDKRLCPSPHEDVCSPELIDRKKVYQASESSLHRRSQSLQERVPERQNMPLFEFLKCPDLNVGKFLEDKPRCQLTFAPRVDNEVHEADKQITIDLPVVQPVDVHEHIGAMLAEEERGTSLSTRKAMVSCINREDVQQKQSQSHVFTKPTSQVDVIEKPHNMGQAYHKDEDGERSPPKENLQIQVLGFNTATCDDEGTSGFQQGNEDGGDITESFLPCIESMELPSVIQDQQECCACMPPETPYDLQTSNLALSFNDDGWKKTGQLNPCVGEEVTSLDCQKTCDRKAIDVDGSSDKISSENLSTQQVVTVNDIFLPRSQNHLGRIDFGVGKGGHNFCGMSGVPSLSSSPSLPSSSLLLSLPSTSSFSVSSSSPSSSSSAAAASSAVAAWSSSYFPSSLSAVASSSSFLSSSLAAAAASSSSSLSSSFPSSSPLSLSSPMGIDRPETMGLGPSSSLSAVAALSSFYFPSSLSPSSSSSAAAVSSAVVALSSSYFPSSSSAAAVALSSSFPSSSLAAAASSSSSFPSSSPLSLSLLMGMDRPETQGLGPSQQAKNFAKNQQNLALLGFNPLRSDSPSLYKQAMAHKRACRLTLGNSWKGASSKISSLGQGHCDRLKQQKMEQQTRQPFAIGPSHPRIHQHKPQPRINYYRSQPRIHEYRPYSRIKIALLIKKPSKKPLSPIIEFSPELSPASLSLSEGPS